MRRIFISYSRNDARFAAQLYDALAAMGAEVWLDTKSIPVGEDWSDAVQAGLTGSDVMLLVVSPSSMDSSNVSDEWKYFHSRDKPIIPVRLAPADMHFQLDRLQYVDFHRRDFKEALADLRNKLVDRGIQIGGVEDAPTPDPTPTTSRRGLITSGLAALFALIAAGLVFALSQTGGSGAAPTATQPITLADVTATVDTQATQIAQLQADLAAATVVIDAVAPTLTHEAQAAGIDLPQPPPTGDIVMVAEGDLWVMAAGANQPNRITETIDVESNPAWSPDGTRIAFERTIGGETRVYIAARDGSNARAVSPAGANAFAPSWSPDGDRLAYHTADQLLISDTDGTNRSVQALADRGIAPAWSPDGSQIAFHTASGPTDFVLNVIPSTGGDAREIGEGRSPAWSPDGSQLAFIRGEAIFIQSIDGGDVREFAPGGQIDGLSWTHEGSEIVYSTNTTGIYDIYAANVATGDTRWITSDGTFDFRQPDWFGAG